MPHRDPCLVALTVVQCLQMPTAACWSNARPTANERIGETEALPTSKRRRKEKEIDLHTDLRHLRRQGFSDFFAPELFVKLV